MTRAELVLDCRAAHGEGITWSARNQRLYWVDIDGRAIWRFDPHGGEAVRWPTPDRVAAVAERRGGGLLVATAGGLAFVDGETGALDPVAEIEEDVPNTRLNDGRCDRQGRFLIGGIDEVDLEPISAVYRVDPDLRVTRVIADVRCANSICFSPDGRTMYFADTPQRLIWAYDYDIAAGLPANRRVLYDFADEPGKPDGSTVDAEGCLWNAEWNGRRVVRITPDGRLDRVIDVPVYNPTCVVFGGRALDTLYIITSRQLMTEAQLDADPLSGSLFAVRPGVGGIAEPAFAG